MIQIIKGESAIRTIMQVDEDELEGIIIKSTSVDGESQIQLQLTRLETNRLSNYFEQKIPKEK